MISQIKYLITNITKPKNIQYVYCWQKNILKNNYNILTFCTRKLHSAQKNVITSKHSDINIPNCTVTDYIWNDMDKWANKTAVVCGVTGKSYKYEEIYKLSFKFAASLKHILKLEINDCVAVMLPNCPDFPLATLGAIQAGCVVTTINPIYTASEISHQLINSKSKVIITTQECCAEVKKSFLHSKQKIPIIIVETNDLPESTISFEELMRNPHLNMDCLKNVERTSNDTVFLPYSSGTTGIPKGVELLNKNIVANFSQIQTDNLKIFEPAIGTHQDVVLCVLPFFHIYGLTITLLSKLSLGVKIVTLPKFVPDTYLNAQANHQANVLYLVPPLVLFLSSNPNVTKKHLDPIKTIMSGAAPLAGSDVERFLEKTQTNVAFMQGYGMTESSPALLIQERGALNFASIGGPVANTNAKIVDIENENNILGPNQIGELFVRGPQVMKGYYENPEATNDIFRLGGWMRTGDMAYYDENHDFYITDRLKELIKVKSFQVAPAELEGVLRTHPDISDAVVIGVPHKYNGETPKAFVVKKKGTSPTAQSIMNFVAENVASYKKLGDLIFVDSIPKNAAGKILRKEVRAKYE